MAVDRMEVCPLCGEELEDTSLHDHLLVCSFDEWRYDHPDHELLNKPLV